MSETRSVAKAAVVLVRPDSPENIGLAARGMANTGFGDLRVVGLDRFEAAAWRTAIHAEPVLESARFFPTLAAAVADRALVLGSTARVRHDFPLVTLAEAVGRVREYPPETCAAFVFGNERTGLTREELGLANVRFHIPQAARQPSYNLGVAVTLTLHAAAFGDAPPPAARRGLPLSHEEQAEAGRRFRAMLDSLGFMHATNRAFISDKVQDIFFRMALTAKDRDIILAMFRKTLEGPREHRKRRQKKRQGAPMNPKELKVIFGNNYKIDVGYKGFTVKTDQPVHDGGDGTAPSPFDYFLVSLAACAGYYALAFCRERKIPTDGLGVVMTIERGEVSKMIDKISIAVTAPAGFPEKYRAALVKSVDHCTVKAHMMRPPQFEVFLAP